jgi:osmotically-inducible protein OsmY
LKNWFADPFFAVSSSITGCPVPRGPLATKEDMEREAHARVERGTRCYQEGKCRKVNSYQYDAEIAEHLRAALANSPVLKGTSVWVTVQRRWIFLQGCVDSMSKKRALEQIARGVPDVEKVFVDVTTDASKPPPYPSLRPSQRR